MFRNRLLCSENVYIVQEVSLFSGTGSCVQEVDIMYRNLLLFWWSDYWDQEAINVSGTSLPVFRPTQFISHPDCYLLKNQ